MCENVWVEDLAGRQAAEQTLKYPSGINCFKATVIARGKRAMTVTTQLRLGYSPEAREYRMPAFAGMTTYHSLACGRVFS